MANTKQAAKRARKTSEQRVANMSLRTALRSAIKKIQKAIGTGDPVQADVALKAGVSTIDRTASRGIIHKNKAARQKSRLAKKAKALQKKS
jgi:small subunit ribosomal protein S20